jgi:DAK2 domain fusion protein YloV
MSPTNRGPVQNNIRYDGDGLRAMFGTALVLLERNVDAINALNVFPVPDGDTGTNMFLTLRDVIDETEALRGAPSADMASAMASAALMGAKGNSGVILSQFFKGLAVGLEGTADFGCEELVRSLQEARTYSYKAIGEPVEGTILTVMTSVAEAALQVEGVHVTVEELLRAVCKGARESVALTPTLLPVLREAGVVDAGGQGLAVILEGIRRHCAGEQSEAGEIAPPSPIGVEGATGTVSHEFLAATDEETYGYCTQFLVQGQGLDVDALRETMRTMGRSAVVVGDENMVQIHVHAEDPGPVVSVGIAVGGLSQVKIENMDSQHGHFSTERRQDLAAVPLVSAVVTVAQGEGLRKVMENLGASIVLAGGDTMNPSVGDLLKAVGAAPSENVIVLPNNGNIVAAARQVVDMSSKNVALVSSRTIPQGIAALLSFNPESGLPANVVEMEEALPSVRTGEITLAMRDVTLNGVSVEKGMLIGLLERKIVAAGDDMTEVLTAIIEKAALADGDLVTLYWGDPLTADEAREIESRVSGAFSSIELELVEGGQPDYHFILSIE